MVVHVGGSNERLYDDGSGRTRWVAENELEFSGWMRLMGLLMPGAFRKQTLEDMKRFKELAENTG